MTRHGLYVLTLAMLNVFLLVGCGEEPQTQPQPEAKKVVAPPPKAAVPQQTVAPSEPVLPRYVYEPAGRRDPFEPLVSAKKATAVVEEVTLTPLQKYNLEQLRLIGVIIGKGEPRAMVVAPDGKSYVLKKGVKVGGNEGVVIDITPEAVHVEERYFDFSGEIRKSVQLIQLPKREGVE